LGDVAIVPETTLEARVLADREWQEGAAWGEPRPGHPEGEVAAHIEEVLRNVDGEALDPADRERLRFVALIHDTFKHRVDRTQPRSGENHHAMIARRFAEKYTDDRELLEVIELHDEAYNSWVKGERGGKWDAAEARAVRLLDRLGPTRDFYLRFYRADNRTGSKGQEPLEWFERISPVS
jgi:HD domain